MKQTILILIAALGIQYAHASHERPSTEVPKISLDYSIGEELFVVANSGLKLRSEPDFDAKVIAIMDFGEMVQILTDSVAWHRYDRVEWLDGHWVYVDYGGVRGYAFDGFLSTVPMPFFGYDAVDCEDLPILLESYISDISYQKYLDQEVEDDSYIETVVGAHTFGVSRSFPGEHHMSFYKTPNATKTLLHLKDVRMSEALHIMLNLLDHCPEKRQIQEDLIYVEDVDGSIKRIQTRSSDLLKIIRTSEGVELRFKTPCGDDREEPVEDAVQDTLRS